MRNLVQKNQITGLIDNLNFLNQKTGEFENILSSTGGFISGNIFLNGETNVSESIFSSNLNNQYGLINTKNSVTDYSINTQNIKIENARNIYQIQYPSIEFDSFLKIGIFDTFRFSSLNKIYISKPDSQDSIVIDEGINAKEIKSENGGISKSKEVDLVYDEWIEMDDVFGNENIKNYKIYAYEEDVFEVYLIKNNLIYQQNDFYDFSGDFTNNKIYIKSKQQDPKSIYLYYERYNYTDKSASNWQDPYINIKYSGEDVSNLFLGNQEDGYCNIYIIQIENTGMSLLTGMKYSSTSPVFELNFLNDSIAPLETGLAELKFCPNENQEFEHSAYLDISGNNSNTYQFQVYGTEFKTGQFARLFLSGQEKIERGQTFDFGIITNLEKKDEIIYLYNSGDLDLSIESINIYQDDFAVFKINSYPDLVPINTTGVLSISFYPRVSNTNFSSYIKIESNDKLGSFSFDLTGKSQVGNEDPIMVIKDMAGQVIQNLSEKNLSGIKTWDIFSSGIYIENTGDKVLEVSGLYFEENSCLTVERADELISIDTGSSVFLTISGEQCFIGSYINTFKINYTNDDFYKEDYSYKFYFNINIQSPIFSVYSEGFSVENNSDFFIGSVDFESNETNITKTISLRNFGNENLIISGVYLSNTSQTNPYYIDNNFQVTIQKNQSIEFPISFLPESDSDDQNVLVFKTNDFSKANGEYSINLKGLSDTKNIEIDEFIEIGNITNNQLIDIGQLLIGQRKDYIFKIKNTSEVDSTLFIRSIDVYGDNDNEFYSENIDSINIKNGEFINLEVSIIPEKIGIKNFTLEIRSTDFENPVFTIYFVCENISDSIIKLENPENQEIYDQNNSRRFVDIPLSGSSNEKIFYIKNISENNYSKLSEIFIDKSGDVGDFYVSQISSNSIYKNQTGTFFVKFQPVSSVGEKELNLSIYSNAQNKNPLNFNLFGTAADALNLSYRVGYFSDNYVNIQGAAETSFNGQYIYNGVLNGYNSYVNELDETITIFNQSGRLSLYSGENVYYVSQEEIPYFVETLIGTGSAISPSISIDIIKTISGNNIEEEINFNSPIVGSSEITKFFIENNGSVDFEYSIFVDNDVFEINELEQEGEIFVNQTKEFTLKSYGVYDIFNYVSVYLNIINQEETSVFYFKGLATGIRYSYPIVLDNNDNIIPESGFHFFEKIKLGNETNFSSFKMINSGYIPFDITGIFISGIHSGEFVLDTINWDENKYFNYAWNFNEIPTEELDEWSVRGNFYDSVFGFIQILVPTKFDIIETTPILFTGDPGNPDDNLRPKFKFRKNNFDFMGEVSDGQSYTTLTGQVYTGADFRNDIFIPSTGYWTISLNFKTLEFSLNKVDEQIQNKTTLFPYFLYNDYRTGDFYLTHKDSEIDYPVTFQYSNTGVYTGVQMELIGNYYREAFITLISGDGPQFNKFKVEDERRSDGVWYGAAESNGEDSIFLTNINYTNNISDEAYYNVENPQSEFTEYTVRYYEINKKVEIFKTEEGRQYLINENNFDFRIKHIPTGTGLYQRTAKLFIATTDINNPYYGFDIIGVVGESPRFYVAYGDPENQILNNTTIYFQTSFGETFTDYLYLKNTGISELIINDIYVSGNLNQEISIEVDSSIMGQNDIRELKIEWTPDYLNSDTYENKYLIIETNDPDENKFNIELNLSILNTSAFSVNINNKKIENNESHFFNNIKTGDVFSKKIYFKNESYNDLTINKDSFVSKIGSNSFSFSKLNYSEEIYESLGFLTLKKDQSVNFEILYSPQTNQYDESEFDIYDQNGQIFKFYVNGSGLTGCYPIINFVDLNGIGIENNSKITIDSTQFVLNNDEDKKYIAIENIGCSDLNLINPYIIKSGDVSNFNIDYHQSLTLSNKQQSIIELEVIETGYLTSEVYLKIINNSANYPEFNFSVALTKEYPRFFAGKLLTMEEVKKGEFVNLYSTLKSGRYYGGLSIKNIGVSDLDIKSVYFTSSNQTSFNLEPVLFSKIMPQQTRDINFSISKGDYSQVKLFIDNSDYLFSINLINPQTFFDLSLIDYKEGVSYAKESFIYLGSCNLSSKTKIKDFVIYNQTREDIFIKVDNLPSEEFNVVFYNNYDLLITGEILDVNGHYEYSGEVESLKYYTKQSFPYFIVESGDIYSLKDNRDNDIIAYYVEGLPLSEDFGESFLTTGLYYIQNQSTGLKFGLQFEPQFTTEGESYSSIEFSDINESSYKFNIYGSIKDPIETDEKIEVFLDEEKIERSYQYIELGGVKVGETGVYNIVFKNNSQDIIDVTGYDCIGEGFSFSGNLITGQYQAQEIKTGFLYFTGLEEYFRDEKKCRIIINTDSYLDFDDGDVIFDVENFVKKSLMVSNIDGAYFSSGFYEFNFIKQQDGSYSSEKTSVNLEVLNAGTDDFKLKSISISGRSDIYQIQNNSQPIYLIPPLFSAKFQIVYNYDILLDEKPWIYGPINPQDYEAYLKIESEDGQFNYLDLKSVFYDIESLNLNFKIKSKKYDYLLFDYNGQASNIYTDWVFIQQPESDIKINKNVPVRYVIQNQSSPLVSSSYGYEINQINSSNWENIVEDGFNYKKLNTNGNHIFEINLTNNNNFQITIRFEKQEENYSGSFYFLDKGSLQEIQEAQQVLVSANSSKDFVVGFDPYSHTERDYYTARFRINVEYDPANNFDIFIPVISKKI